MNTLFIRLTVLILIIVGANMAVLAFVIGETFPEQLAAGKGVFLLVSFGGSFLLLSVFIYIVVRNMIAPLDDVTDMVNDLSQGHYWRRIAVHDTNHVFHHLIEQTNELACYLQRTTEHQHADADRLQAVIRHMPSGLLFINEKGRITLANATLPQMIHWHDDQQDVIYYESGLPEQIVDAIQAAFEDEKEVKTHIQLHAGIERRMLDLHVAPIQRASGHIRGIVVVLHDITDVKRLEQIRKDFVYNVSHELKTPLTSIKGFSETLLDGAMYDEENCLHFLRIISRESDRLHRLIQDLLALSDIEQRNFDMHWREVDIVDLVEQIVLLVQDRVHEKQLTVHVDGDARRVFVYGDSDRLHQIVLNLVSNAIQYTPAEGNVTIGIRSVDEDDVELCVQDNGIGIAQEELPRIFERFYRVDKARSRESGGTGLGLAIVKHLVDAHHGRITVDSERGKGTRFCLYLPRYAEEDTDML